MTPSSATSTITYTNTQYGFNFTLPESWREYVVVDTAWTGVAATSTGEVSGPKLLMRHPSWTEAKPYEDIPVLIFTLAQWNDYFAEKFSVSAAPIQARELDRNNIYVFALPPRWDFDYREGFAEAEAIVASNPLRAYTIGVASMPEGKLNISVICDQSLSYMTFIDATSSSLFVADCKAGKHPEVIEKYKADLHLGNGATI